MAEWDPYSFPDGGDDCDPDGIGAGGLFLSDGGNDSMSNDGTHMLARLAETSISGAMFERKAAARGVLETFRQTYFADEDVGGVIAVIEKLVDDVEQSVRTEVMDQMPQIALFCHEESPRLDYVVPKHILPHIVRLMTDHFTQVRQASQSGLLILLERGIIASSQVAESVLPVIVEHTQEYASEDLRAEMTAFMIKLAPLAGKEITVNSYLELFCRLCDDSLFQVRRVCATGMGDLANVIGTRLTEVVILPKFLALCKDTVWGVRKGCAEVFTVVSTVAQLVTRKKTLGPAFVALLQDSSRWVRISAYQTLGPFITTFAADDSSTCTQESSDIEQAFLERFVALHVLDQKAKSREAEESTREEINFSVENPDENLDREIPFVAAAAATTKTTEVNNTDTSASTITSATATDSCNSNNSTSCVLPLKFKSESSESTTEIYVVVDVDQTQVSNDNYSSVEKREENVSDPSDSVSSVQDNDTEEKESPDLSIMPENVHDTSTEIIASQAEATESSENLDILASPTVLENLTPEVDKSDTAAIPLVLGSSGGGYDAAQLLAKENEANLASSEGNSVEEESNVIIVTQPVAGGKEASAEVEGELAGNTVKIEVKDQEQPDETGELIKHNYSKESSESGQGVEITEIEISEENGDLEQEVITTRAPHIENKTENISKESDEGFKEEFELQDQDPNDPDKPEVNQVNYSVGDDSGASDSVGNAGSILTGGSNGGAGGSITDVHRSYLNLYNASRDQQGEESARMASVRLMDPYDDDDWDPENTFPGYGDDLSSIWGGKGCRPRLLDEIPKSLTAQQQDVVPVDLLEHYTSMCEPMKNQAIDTALTGFCAYNLPAVVLTLGAQNWSILRECYESLACSMQWKIRYTLASSLHEIARVIGPELAERDLVPFFNALVKDVDEVRVGLLRNLASFIKILGIFERRKCLDTLRSFLETDNKRNWRFRLELTRQLEQLTEIYEADEVYKYLRPLAIDLVKDGVAEVRKTALCVITNLIVRVTNTFECGEPNLVHDFLLELVETLGQSDKWVRRQTFAALSGHLVGNGALKPNQFVEDILPHLQNLSQDPVPNVRLIVAQTMVSCVSKLEFDDHSNQLMSSIIEKLQFDLDRDVRYFSSIQGTQP